MLRAIEEYAAECSMVKVFCSEVLDFVVDEGVQIHGGYGYHQDYDVERAYRDSRINRIFEGTNEINRLVTTGMLLKRAARGHLPLVSAVQKLMGEILSGQGASDGSDEESRLVSNAKKITLMAIGLAYQRFLDTIEKQQEIMMSIADMMMETFAMESSLLRSRKLGAGGKGADAAAMAAVFLRDAMARVELSARHVLGACSEGDALRTNMAVLRRLAKHDPINAIALRRQIATRLLDRERYVV
jgi:alkylation response protein AidB-like acyl-CoA dehydrogenase